MTTTVYGTQVTAYFLAAVAAFEAGGPALNIAGGTLVVGDGGGTVPSISALIAANGVTHEVWRGTTIDSVSVDALNPDQLDILVEVPGSVGGVEIGPFNVYEFAILDAGGNCCVVGTTNLYKGVSGGGMTTSLAWVAAIVYSVASSVTVTPPSAGYTTMTAVIAAYNANLPTCVFPLTKSDTTGGGGWIDRTFGITPATTPALPVTPTTSAAAMGSGRPASAGEFAAGHAVTGTFQYPWVTPAHIFSLNLRTRLQANVTFYVATTGNDTTGNGSSSAPWATPQCAANYIQDNLDLGNYSATVLIADGTYGAPLAVDGPFVGAQGARAVIFQGDLAAPSNVVFAITSGVAITASEGAMFQVRGIKVVASGSVAGIDLASGDGGVGVAAGSGAKILFDTMNFGACGAFHMMAQGGGFISATGSYVVSGNAPSHWAANAGGNLQCVGNTITLTGTPAFSGGFAEASVGGQMIVSGNVYTGAATGPHYTVSKGGIIVSGATLPGSTAGVNDGTGIYA